MDRYTTMQNPNVAPRVAPHSPIVVLAPILALALTLLPGVGVMALSSDRDQEIVIEANEAEIKDDEQVAIYIGDVVIVQGSLRITGDKVWIYYDDDSEMTKLVSVGEPASFRQLPDGDEVYRTGRAERMEYYRDEDLVVMLGKARYGKGADEIRADRIVYDSLASRMKAGTRPEKAKTRVQVRILPKKNNKKIEQQ